MGDFINPKISGVLNGKLKSSVGTSHEI